MELFGYPGFAPVQRLFEEVPTRVIIACAPEEASRIQQIFSGARPAPWRLGAVTDGSFRIRMQSYKETDEPFNSRRAKL